MKKSTIHFASLILLTSPVIVFAQAIITGGPATTPTNTVTGAMNGVVGLGQIIDAITKNVGNSLSTLLFSVAMIVFFYGIIEFILGQRGGDGAKTATGKKFIGWGLIALFVMFSVYGFIKFGQDIFFPKQNLNKITIPSLDFGSKAPATSSSSPLGGPSGGGDPGVGTPVGTGGASKKALNASCTAASECQSNNCGPKVPYAGDVCIDAGAGSGSARKADGEICVSNASCTSNNCGYGPYGTRVCEAGSGGAGSAPKVYATVADCVNDGGYKGSDNKCYNDGTCLNGCNITNVSNTVSGKFCDGKPEGTLCSVGGFTGTCTSDDNGTFSCYKASNDDYCLTDEGNPGKVSGSSCIASGVQ